MDIEKKKAELRTLLTALESIDAACETAVAILENSEEDKLNTRVSVIIDGIGDTLARTEQDISDAISALKPKNGFELLD